MLMKRWSVNSLKECFYIFSFSVTQHFQVSFTIQIRLPFYYSKLEKTFIQSKVKIYLNPSVERYKTIGNSVFLIFLNNHVPLRKT